MRNANKHKRLQKIIDNHGVCVNPNPFIDQCTLCPIRYMIPVGECFPTNAIKIAKKEMIKLLLEETLKE